MQELENSAGVRIYVNKIMLGIFLVILLVFSLLNLQRGNNLLFSIQLVMSLVTILAILFYDKTSVSRYSQHFSLLYTGLILGLFSLIVLNEDSSPSSFIWVCLFPIASYTINGLRNGFWATCISIILVFGVYLYRMDVDLFTLPNATFIDYGFATLTVWLLTHIYEKKNVESADRLIELNKLDALTKLKNRTHFYQVYRKYAGSFVSLISIDIDGLKDINEHHGHLSGDVVLLSIANILKEISDEKDIYAFRTAGDEFAVFVPDADSKTCIALTKSLYQQISESQPIIKKEVIKFQTSISISFIQSDGNNLDSLMSNADVLMKQSKSLSINQIAWEK